MSKALSNGTLSLRFMQNAQRAKQEAQVEAEQAKVKDEAEWEIPQEVKEQWGIASSSASTQSQSKANITYESSYIPFIFSSGVRDDLEPPSRVGSSQIKGRRKFSTHGEEVVAAVPSAGPQTEKPQEQYTNDQRPTSISGFQAPLSIRASPKQVTGKNSSASRRTKTVQMLIREDNGRGLRDPSPLPRVISAPAPTSSSAAKPMAGFLKPAGVDDPATSAKHNHKSLSARDSAGVKRIRGHDIPETASGNEAKSKRKRVANEDV